MEKCTAYGIAGCGLAEFVHEGCYGTAVNALGGWGVCRNWCSNAPSCFITRERYCSYTMACACGVHLVCIWPTMYLQVCLLTSS